jgi:hypothetical protein
MERGRNEGSLARVRAFFTALLRRDASGRTWLRSLLAATPNGSDRLGELVERPGYLVTPLAVATVSGLLGAFEYPAAPPRELLAWFIDHSDRLTWPEHSALSAESVRLRRALLYDDPPGSRARARERARDLLAAGAPLSPVWWRFEDNAKLDCVLITDKLIVTIAAGTAEGLAPATDWYPQRSELVRNLEAAKQLAQDRCWASLLLSDQSLPEAGGEYLARTIAGAAPHLDASRRDELLAAYLGNLTWDRACAAVDLPAELAVTPSVVPHGAR